MASPFRAAPGNSLQGISQQTPTSALAQCGWRQSSAIQRSIVSDGSDLSLYRLGCLCSRCSTTQGCCCCTTWEVPGSHTGQQLIEPHALQDYLPHDQCHSGAATHTLFLTSELACNGSYDPAVFAGTVMYGSSFLLSIAFY